MTLKKFGQNAAIVAGTLLVEWFIWWFLIPVMWRQGSSAAFRTTIAVIAISFILPFITWWIVAPSKPKRK